MNACKTSLRPVLIVASLISVFLAASFAVGAEDDGEEHINALTEKGRGSPVKLENKQSLATRATFRPPVQITISAKTESTDLRIGYAANQVIFNWENSQHELRVDGGPANGQHKPGAGMIRPNKYATIKWVVLPTKQSIFVDGELRYEHEGDYSKINNPVSIFSHKAQVTVRTIKVKQLAAGNAAAK